MYKEEKIVSKLISVQPGSRSPYEFEGLKAMTTAMIVGIRKKIINQKRVGEVRINSVNLFLFESDLMIYDGRVSKFSSVSAY